MEPLIICAIDDATAEAVASTAAELAPALGARVLLLHVESDPAVFNSSSDGGAELLRAVGGLLPYGTHVEEDVVLGAPAGEIVAVAEDMGASLIVVGSRRRGPHTRALAGSILENVLNRAICPVVIAPAGARHRPPAGSDEHRSVLVGVGATQRTLAVTRLGRELAASLGDRLVLTHARDGAPLPGVVREAHESAGPDAVLALAGGSAAFALDRASDREHARLIVIGAGDLEPAAAASGEPIALQLAGIALCPVVVLPEAAPSGDLLRGAHREPVAVAAGGPR